MEKIATRVSYGNALVELGATDPDVVVFEADLAEATMTKGFKKTFPDRFYEMGIAEANMYCAAAGMASCGKKPFASTFAIFSAGRCWEQIRNSIVYNHENVVVVGTHAGISVGQDGATHQCIEDIGLMRVIPGMTVICPCDDFETHAAVHALAEYGHPAYLRVGRMPVEVVTRDSPNYRFEIGKGAVLRDGSDATIIACGIMVQQALQASKLLQSEGVSVRVIDMHTVKPLDEELVLQAAHETGAIITAEEHNIYGGLGSAVAELLAENAPIPMVIHGVQDRFGHSGDPEQLLEHYGLTVRALVDSVKKAVSLKNACGNAAC